MTLMLSKVNEPEWKQLHRIADGLRPEVQQEIYRALDGLKGQIPTASLVDLIENGELTKVLAAVNLDLPDMTALQNAIGKIAAQSGARAATQLNMAFDLVNPRAVAWAERYGGQLITEVNRETQQAVSEIVQRGFLEGTAPRVQAIAIEQVVGLHSRDAGAVSKYLTGLVGDGISERRAKELANTYSNRLLRKRANMIARTETMRASNMGQQLAWEAATDSGLLLDGEVEKVWIVTDDDRTCPRCLSLEDATIELDGSFTESGESVPRSGATTTRTPPLHPMCRCAMGIVEIEAPVEVFEPTPPEPPVTESPLSKNEWEVLNPKGKYRGTDPEYVRDWMKESSPQGDRLQDFATRWNGKTRVRRYKEDVASVLGGAPADTPALERARTVVDALRSSPIETPTLSRGFAEKGTLDKIASRFVAGEEFDMALSSWSSNGSYAKRFAAQTARRKGPGATEVLFRMTGANNQALPIDAMTDIPEWEWLAGGRMRIAKVAKSKGAVIVDLEQIAGL